MPDLDAMKDLLLEIVRNEILRIRVLGRDGRADECSIMADHIHNLPELIRTPHVKYLRYYLDLSRRVYVMETSIPNAAYEKEWSQLEKILEQWESEIPRQGHLHARPERVIIVRSQMNWPRHNCMTQQQPMVLPSQA